jgi:hypothetical protein
MNLLGVCSANKKYLLPIVLLAAVIFAYQGASVPNYPDSGEITLSGKHKAIPSHNALCKNFRRSSTIKAPDTTGCIEFCCHVQHFGIPSFYYSVPHHESLSIITAELALIPARAPPV